MKNILIREVRLPKLIEILIISILVIEVLMMATASEELMDYYPSWALPLMLIILSAFGLVETIISYELSHRKRKVHIDIKKIFDGVSETSNIVEDLVISRLKNEVREVVGNGASLRSIYVDVDRIKFIASTKSMRLVEQYCEGALLATSVAIFEN